MGKNPTYDEMKQEIQNLRQIDQELAQTKMQLEDLLDASPAVVYRCQPGGDYPATFISKNIRRQLGYEPEEFTDDPKFWAEHIHPEDRHTVFDGLRHSFKKGQHSHEYRFMHKDGTYRWMRDELRLVYDADGRPLDIVGNWIDITERKLTEAAFHETESRYRLLVETHDAPIVVLDKEGVFLAVNPIGASNFGLEVTDVLGRSIRDLFPNKADVLFERHKGIIDSGEGDTFEDVFHFPDGERWYLSKVQPAKDRNGTIYGVMLISHDITDRKRIEEALREERNFSDTLLQSSPTFFVAVGATGETLMMNETMLNGLGYEKDEVLGSNYLETFVPDDDRELLFNVFNNLEDLNEVVQNESHVITKDGRELFLEWHTRPMQGGNRELDYVFSVGIDITERKQAQEELRESEERFRGVFEGSLDAILLSDPESGEVIDANPAAEELLLRPREEIIGLQRTKLHPTHLKSSVEQMLSRQALEEEMERPVEISVLGSDGRETSVEILAHIIQIDGVPVFYETLRDISERKRIEGVLEESEQRYRLVAESIYDIIWTSDMDLRFNYVSPSVERFIGHTPEELVGKTIIEHLTPSSSEAATEMFLNAFAAEDSRVSDSSKSRTMELQRLHKNGSVVWGELSFTFLRDTKGRLAGILGVTRDITERKEAERVLKASEEKYRRLVQDSIDAIVIVKGLHIRLVNQAALRMWGCQTEEEMVGRPFTDFVGPEYRKLMEERGEARKRGQDIPDRYEFKGVRKGGYEFQAELLVRNIMYEGEVARQGVIRDITESKRHEEELMKIERLESLGILAGGIAHDFNNIMTPILSNISMARMYGELDSEVDEMLTDAEKATLRAKNLTQQLLTFSKGGVPVKRLASVSKLLRESSKFALSGSNMRCQYSLPENLWAVEMDEGQIGQVVHNAVINADQASPAGGTIRIGAENVVIGDKDSLPLEGGKYVRISVADSGIGIPENHLSHIFDPFYTTKVKGSGLGLSTSFTIIRQHEGNIQVESEVGVGTTFDIYLPASEEPLEIQEKRREKEKAGQGRILLVDDEEAVRTSVGKLLKRLGYEVGFAEDGAEGTRVYEEAMKAKRPFDLVIMDLTMPGGLAGQQAVEKLKKIDPGIKVIVSSGYSEDPVLSNFQDFGFSDVLVKPYKADDLAEVIHRVLAEVKG